tara:strand:- start:448 stop:717 length:270 start_codon:yes stop_codon:yes gene_type:complete
MLVKLIEVFKPQDGRVHLDEIHVAPMAVTTIRREPPSQMINEAHSLGLNPSAEFSRITVMEGSMSKTIVVVGSPEEVKRKLGGRQLLRD